MSSNSEGETPEFQTPWRDVTWGNPSKVSLISGINQIQPSITNLKCLRVIMVGPPGSGKSSFINSVNNAFQGRITSNAMSDSCGGGKSFTTEQYRECKMKTGNTKLPIVFSDVMGLEAEDKKGYHPDDIIQAINGNIKYGYEFNPEKPISPEDPYYNKDPDLSDEVYCLVYVLAADKIRLAHDDIFKKLRNIRLKVCKTFGLPQVVVMTNVDQVCPVVKNNIWKVYHSKKIKEKMELCSSSLGVPMCHIFPVKNYHEEIVSNEYMDILILQAFTQIMQLAKDNVEIRLEKKDSQNVREKQTKSE
ncbi:interferon-induced protein 44-like isoform X1 [Misgurnus anguillicaudatus]|uniref:interferon-induced protein 44-like isoform X1 n=1 Tax=Misgurnus anguillicaudatus TaxID=75329 RepID=UPI003CCFDDA9